MGNRLPILECPACGAIPAGKAITQKKYWVEPLSAEISFTYVLCHSCGFLFVSDPLDQNALQTYYENALTLRKDSIDEIETRVFGDQMRFMLQNEPSNPGSKNAVEIGCDTAQFLDFLNKQAGLKTFYSEYSKAACQIIEAKGLHKNFESSSAFPMDYIIARHVLEHIPQPLLFLKNWLTFLKPQGRFFIEVPDWTHLDRGTDRLTFEHLNHFTLPSLSILLDRAGYVVEAHEFAATPGYHTTSGTVLRVLASRNPCLISGDREKALKNYLEKADEDVYGMVRELIQKKPAKKIAFYAASWISSDILMNSGIKPEHITAIFDIDKRKQGKMFHGVPVHAPEDIATLRPGIIVINSSYFSEIEENLRKLGYTGEIYRTYDVECSQK